MSSQSDHSLKFAISSFRFAQNDEHAPLSSSLSPCSLLKGSQSIPDSQEDSDPEQYNTSDFYHVFTAEHYSPYPSSSKTASGEHIKRPPNAFMLYRKEKYAELLETDPEAKTQNQTKISARISRLWRKESGAVRMHFTKKADAAKIQHAIDHPHYQYHPMKRGEKEHARLERRLQKDATRRLGDQDCPDSQDVESGVSGLACHHSRQLQFTFAVPPTYSTSMFHCGNLPMPSIISSPNDDSGSDTQISLQDGVRSPSPPVSRTPSPTSDPVSDDMALDESSIIDGASACESSEIFPILIDPPSSSITIDEDCWESEATAHAQSQMSQFSSEGSYTMHCCHNSDVQSLANDSFMDIDASFYVDNSGLDVLMFEQFETTNSSVPEADGLDTLLANFTTAHSSELQRYLAQGSYNPKPWDEGLQNLVDILVSGNSSLHDSLFSGSEKASHLLEWLTGGNPSNIDSDQGDNMCIDPRLLRL